MSSNDFFLYKNEYSKLKNAGASSIYFKILLNYFQSISIINNFDLKWPYYAKGYVRSFSSAGSFSSDAFSFDCFLYDHEIKTSEIIFKTIFFSLFPIILNLVSFVFFYLLYWKTKKSQKNRFIVVYIVSSIFLQPAILKLLFQNLICMKIDDQSYLKSNLEENCNDSSYNLWLHIYFFILFFMFVGFMLLFIQCSQYGYAYIHFQVYFI